MMTIGTLEQADGEMLLFGLHTDITIIELYQCGHWTTCHVYYWK